jgi:hypothetical protein
MQEQPLCTVPKTAMSSAETLRIGALLLAHRFRGWYLSQPIVLAFFCAVHLASSSVFVDLLRLREQKNRVLVAVASPRNSDAEPSQRSDGKRGPLPLRVYTVAREAPAQSSNATSVQDFASALERVTSVGVEDTSTASGPVSPVSVSAIMEPVREDMEQMNVNLRNVVGKRHPMLVSAADQIFGAGGKKLRPAIVFLVSRATAATTGLRYATALTCCWNWGWMP